MFIHAVYFWLKDNLTPQELTAFREGIHSLATIESIQQCHIGIPPTLTAR